MSCSPTPCSPDANTLTTAVTRSPTAGCGLDHGPDSLQAFPGGPLADCKTVIWNGPYLGVFEFDKSRRHQRCGPTPLAELQAARVLPRSSAVVTPWRAVERMGVAEKNEATSPPVAAPAWELLEGQGAPRRRRPRRRLTSRAFKPVAQGWRGVALAASGLDPLRASFGHGISKPLRGTVFAARGLASPRRKLLCVARRGSDATLRCQRLALRQTLVSLEDGHLGALSAGPQACGATLKISCFLALAELHRSASWDSNLQGWGFVWAFPERPGAALARPAATWRQRTKRCRLRDSDMGSGALNPTIRGPALAASPD